MEEKEEVEGRTSWRGCMAEEEGSFWVRARRRLVPALLVLAGATRRRLGCPASFFYATRRRLGCISTFFCVVWTRRRLGPATHVLFRWSCCGGGGSGLCGECILASLTARTIFSCAIQSTLLSSASPPSPFWLKPSSLSKKRFDPIPHSCGFSPPSFLFLQPTPAALYCRRHHGLGAIQGVHV